MYAVCFSPANLSYVILILRPTAEPKRVEGNCSSPTELRQQSQQIIVSWKYSRVGLQISMDAAHAESKILKQSSWDWEEVSTDKRAQSGPVAVKRENWK